VTIINSTFVIRFKFSVTRQKQASLAATIHRRNPLGGHFKKEHSMRLVELRLKTSAVTEN